MSEMKIQDFEKNIGYQFKDLSLLKLALTHSSYGNEVHHDRMMNNERLEFLGDAVLELVVSDFLFTGHPEMPEGKLSKTRASMVCESTLAICARDINLPDYIKLGKGERLTGGRFRDSITSDAMEALIGAIYLDGGIECASDFINAHVLNDIENKQLFVDSKSILQERVQAMGLPTPEYEMLAESGPDHHREFVINVLIDGKISGVGIGKTKKAAQQAAAYDAITKM